jgi:5-methylcytosine-specific restriction enzyme A
MPYAAHRFCGYAGCHKYALPGGYYCEDHRQATAHEYRRDRTDVGEQAFYRSAQWSAVRRHYLDGHPLCEQCEKEGKVTAATMVHHKVSVRQDMTLALVESNLESLCTACHAALHPEKGGSHE